MTESPAPIALVLLGGFLGAGKTSTIVALARHWMAAGKRVGVIANDQAGDLVDTALFRANGLLTSEVAGGCFCCRYDAFIARTDELVEAHRPDVLLAEPVGSCTDIVATVINPIKRHAAERFAAAPYAVLLDPIRARRVLGKFEPVGLSERVTYIFKMQQQEADAIVITKIDLLSTIERERVAELVRAQFNGRRVMMLSAKTGEGLEEFAGWLSSAASDSRALEDIDYDIYAAGEAELGWLNSVLSLEAESDRDVDAVLVDLGRDLKAGFRDQQLEIAHAKMRLDGDTSAATLNLVDVESPVQLSQSSSGKSSAVTLTINLRVQAEPQALELILRDVVERWAARHGLAIMSGSGQAFKPGRPVPTHRLVSA